MRLQAPIEPASDEKLTISFFRPFRSSGNAYFNHHQRTDGIDLEGGQIHRKINLLQ